VTQSLELAHQGKQLDVNGDYVPDDQSEGVIKSNAAFDEPLSRRKVISRHWRPPRQYLLEELTRIMNRQALEYLPEISNNIAHDLPEASRIGAQHDWALYNGSVYIKPRFFEEGLPISSNNLYLLVNPDDLPDADWRSKVDDKIYFLALNKIVVTRLCSHITEAVAIRARNHIKTRSASHTFHLDDEKNDFDKAEDDANPDHQHQPQHLIGGSAAAHTIYTVTQQALNELLDPAFLEREFNIEQETQHLEPYRAELDRLHRQILSVTDRSAKLLQRQKTNPSPTPQQAADFIAQTLAFIGVGVSPPSAAAASTFHHHPTTTPWTTAITAAYLHSRTSHLLELISIRNPQFVWLNIIATSTSDLAHMVNADNEPLTAWDMQGYVRRYDMLKRFNLERDGGIEPGKMGLEEFRAWVARGGEGSGRLAKWVGSWLGLVVL